MRIFFAGPLTNLENPQKTKAWYDKLDHVAKDNGFETFWAFRSGTDPMKNPDVDPDYIYQKDLTELEKSNLMIAYIGEPTTGTGEELEYAKEHNIPVYVLFEKGKAVSRMILGNPGVKGTIQFTSHEDALLQLDTLLKTINKRITK